jgi:DNA-directed RNA polymerase alpha subunit
MEFTVERGRGYLPADQSDGLPIGVIPVDAIFGPVQKVKYHVEHTRVGQMTNYDKLVLEVWTDGTITAVDAVSRSGDILRDGHLAAGKLESAVVEHGVGRGWHCCRTRPTRRSKTSTSPYGRTTASSAAD